MHNSKYCAALYCCWQVSRSHDCQFSNVFKKNPDYQELRCREEELTRAQLQQRLLEQNLAQKERELEMREIDLAARELHILIFASNMSHTQPPQPNKRKGEMAIPTLCCICQC